MKGGYCYARKNLKWHQQRSNSNYSWLARRVAGIENNVVQNMILEDIEDPIKQKVLRELTLNPAAVERLSYPVATRNVIIRMRS